MKWISVNDRLPNDDDLVLVYATITVSDSKTHTTIRNAMDAVKFITSKDSNYFCTLANWHVTQKKARNRYERQVFV